MHWLYCGYVVGVDMVKKKDIRLNVEKIIEEFEKSEQTSGHRNGTFKIEKPFDEALDTILKVKPGLGKDKTKR